ncbi:MAG: flagellar motor switch protein FliM, partial [Ilumatobacter sp.]|nr:flagellar motor switch protein FliM [Ilumatobacter sp.]
MALDELLSDEEVNALMNAVTGGIELAPSAAAEAREDALTYDFRAPRRIISSFAPTLEMINDRFMTSMRSSLLGMMQQFVGLTDGGVQVLSLGDYVNTLPLPSSINMVRVLPLRATALVVFEPHLVTCMVDGFFGGGRRTAPVIKRTDFTGAERRIIRRALDTVLMNLTNAWASVMPLQLQRIGTETNPEYVPVMGASEGETMIVNVVQVGLEGGSGAFHVVIPYSMLEPLRAEFTSLIQTTGEELDEKFMHALLDGVAGVDVEVSSTLAHAEITIEELMRLKADDVVPMRVPPEVTLDVEGIPVYRGTYGT